MEAQERDLLTTLLARLKSTASQPKDPEADALIRQAMREQPDAPYFLAQTVLIQDLSLHNAQNQIAELQQQLADAQQAAKPAATSFLGGLFGSRQPAPPPAPPAAASVPPAGPWSRAPQVAAAPPAQPYGQPYAQPQPGYQPGYGQPPGGGFMGGGMGGGGGFLRSAAATAAGIAGGALLFQGIESLFGRSASAGILGGQGGMTPGLGETVVNNYYGDQGGQNTDAWGGSGAGGDQDVSSADYGGAGGDQDFSSADYSGGGDQDFSSDQDFSGGSDFSGGGDMNQC
ncbi:MAG TPA: DUF2076 domain-containing protein [Stellaceae bacterium]|jgi:hypothetical protein